MTTANSGFSTFRGDQTSEEDRKLVEEFIRKNGVTQLQPAGADGNESSLGTRDRIAHARREFRKARREAAANKSK
jgi:hypothetical protein